jgi:hypothetical protein
MNCPKCGSETKELVGLHYCLNDECPVDYIRFLPGMDGKVKRGHEEKVKP